MLRPLRFQSRVCLSVIIKLKKGIALQNSWDVFTILMPIESGASSEIAPACC
jgi:hypothetical protein